MRATTTLPQPADPHSFDSRVAWRALFSVRESHAIALTPEGNCHARDLVERWVQLTGEPMPIDMLRQELRIYMHGHAPDYRTECAWQRLADEALAVALVNDDVRFVRRRKRDRQ
jgi:hypothetical protein